MTELLPTRQASDLRHGLLDYLATTFALADSDAEGALRDFLVDVEDGIFKGPYIRTRLPFTPAASRSGTALEGLPADFVPYSHQAAAFARLRRPDVGRPAPTLVTTGTGSGKTECFLFPILDHVVRVKNDPAASKTGVKALILYPMNALANDQAQRLARLITDTSHGPNPLAGVTAALYTGQQGANRTRVTAQSLITDRNVIRRSPPDILLTNYKMLDQLLLRHEDQELWRLSADTLQYVVLDEFHTYDGAQGTDVAMLLRRLGLALKSHWPSRGGADDTHTAHDWDRPLGKATPVGTSATLGDKGDPRAMLGFAETVFGETFASDSVITESRLPPADWLQVPPNDILGLEPVELTTTLAEEINHAVDARGSSPDGAALCATIINRLWADNTGEPATARPLASLAKASPVVKAIVEATQSARHLNDVEGEIFAGEDPAPTKAETRRVFLTNVIAALSHLRAVHGREFITVETHLWIRELTRIDRFAASPTRFRWSDDGTLDLGADEDDLGSFPAIYCRHCGRSGWGVGLAHTGEDLLPDQGRVRADHAAGEGRFRALIHAPSEALDRSEQGIDALAWLDVQARRVSQLTPDPDDDRLREGRLIPVLALSGPRADARSRDDHCPSCQQADGIRFLGSAIATLLSVSLSTLFGAAGLDRDEKKALVFTDSVQDAAHRAGFVASRSHTLSLRAVLHEAVRDQERSLPELVDAVLELAGMNPMKRYRLLPPEYADRDEFRDFWFDPESRHRRPRAIVRRRLLFDAVLEFGLQSRIGRTLEQTGAVGVTVDAGTPAALLLDARSAIKGHELEEALDHPLNELPDERLVGWVRGTLERIRLQGGIQHEWFDLYVKEDGNRYRIWGGRRKDEGMPAFPRGRSAPAFPRVGGKKAGSDPLLDSVTDSQSWYARWTARVLGISPHYGARLVRSLLDRLAGRHVLQAINTDSGGTAFAIGADRIVISPTTDRELSDGHHRLSCDVCRTSFSGSSLTTYQLLGMPCLLARCTGHLHPEAMDPANYYRGLYATTDMRVVVAREHTSLLPDRDRIVLENSFRRSSEDPGAPNVLVATPTLEMGIDIGDLSMVFLASLPRSVASYLQRVGRAGRQTGNALNLAFVTGRGELLPRLGDPLSMINGAVRPPATYLSADEILRRQYFASILDGFARTPDAADHPRTAGAAIGSAAPGSFLGRAVAAAEDRAAELLAAFLGGFSDLQPQAVSRLHTWATPGAARGSSGLAQGIHDSVRRWTSHRETLTQRRLTILTAVPALEQKANSPAATDDDRRSLRVAKAAVRLINNKLAGVESKYWIGVLEEYGLLPNYTLLDDGVSLDVAMSWFDPDAGEYESESTTFRRSSANALREFAPGATFYARGFEIEVDALDLGSEGDAMRLWGLCPDCGYADDLEATGTVSSPSECPRCGSEGLADLQQRITVVEFDRASADIRRDDARIDDRRDDRKRTSFTIVPAADIDPAQISARWFVSDYDFGVSYLNRLTLRWFNVGLGSTHAPARSIAGRTQPTPLFRVCEGCGHLDRSARANSPSEHRPWCPHRRASAESARAVALSRTLQTQGTVITLPWTVTTGDGFALPSLEAAVLMGLRDQFGGTPSHIGVEVIKAPAPGGKGTVDALLLHDVVPGGTGYLADLADPHRVWSLLRGAWKTLSECPCEEEGRLACHRCLLPLAPPHRAASVSRESARRHLEDILTAGGGGEPPTSMGWPIHDFPPAPSSPESNLELHFRSAFTRLMADLGATVKESPGPLGNTVRATVAGVQWKLEPQVLMHGCKPDFVLSSSLPVPQVAIFTDGYAYHAAPNCNRIADDASKRANLRSAGVEVLAVTYSDVFRYVNHKPTTAPSWFSPQIGQVLMQAFNYNASAINTMLEGPFAWLAAWMRNPNDQPRRRLAAALPFMLTAGGPADAHLTASENLAGPAVRLLKGESLTPSDGSVSAWWWRQGPVGALVRARSAKDLDIALVIDDRAEAVGGADFKKGWQDWLRLSNALMLRTDLVHTDIVSIGSVPVTAPEPPEADSIKVELFDPLWAETIDLSVGDRAKDLASRMASAGLPVPDLVGDEIGASAIPVDFAWNAAKVAVLVSADTADRADVRAAGWTIVDPEPKAIADALAAEEE